MFFRQKGGVKPPHSKGFAAVESQIEFLGGQMRAACLNDLQAMTNP
jgi:hypothetical protein